MTTELSASRTASPPDSAKAVHAALAAMDDVLVLVFDSEMRILELHGGALARHGYDASRIVGRRAPDVLPVPAWERLGPLYARTLAGVSSQIDIASGDGNAVYVTHFAPVLDAEGVVVGGTATARDVTAQRRADAALDLFETSFGAAPIGMALVDLDGGFMRVNEALCRLLGRTEDELLRVDFQQLTHAEDLDSDLALLQETLAGTRSLYRLDKRYLRPGGEVVEARLSVALVRDAAGRPAHFVSQIVDLSVLEAARRELAEVNGRLQAILDHSPMAIWTRDLEERWTLVNPEACRRLGHPQGELLGRPLPETHPERSEDAIAGDREVLSTGRPGSFDVVDLDPGTGEERHLLTLRFPVRVPGGRIVGVGGISVDVTERERAARELAAANELFEATFATSPVGMLVSRDLPGGGTEVVQCNAAFAAMSGRAPEELLGRASTHVIHRDDLPTCARMRGELAAGHPTSAEVRFRHPGGQAVSALVAPSLVHGADGERFYVVQALDVSERRRFEDQLQHLADHDALTGLLNRRRFEEELAREVGRVRDGGRPAALVMLDLDGFRAVNDVSGHATGDGLIVRVGAALARVLGPEDVLARTGGDEFAAILADVDPAAAGVVAERLIDAVRGHGRLTTDGRVAEVTASVGLTTLPPGVAEEAEVLLIQADIATHQAKEEGDRVSSYERSEGRREQLTHHSDWIGRLRRALAEERFELHAQPVLPLLDDAPAGDHFELLLRLRGTDGKLVPPVFFLEHAERNGLIGEIDRWVLGRAVRLLHGAHAAGRDLNLAVNLSARTMQDPRIADHLTALLEAHPVPAGKLVVEVTETAAITNVERAGELARELRRLGCLLALDDFGSGFASFYYLKHLEFDVLKIDGDFIEELPRSRTDQLVVRAVVDIARGLGARIVAERVQDDETVELLRELGVDYGQGYHLGRPGPLPATGASPS